MAFCVVTATVNRAATPWVGGMIYFTLLKGSYSISAHYPKTTIAVEIRPDGKAIVALWNNEAGFIPTKWLCQMPDGESFEFSIPIGLEEADLEYLRSLTTQPPNPPGLGAIVQAAIAQHNADLLAHPNLAVAGESALPSLPAGENISALRVLAISGNSYVYADPSDADSVWAIAGISTIAVASGQAAVPVRDRAITDTAWNWETGKPIFLGTNGTLTQVLPLSGFLVSIAQPLSPKTIFVSIEEAIAL
jgi:hypothetical protein